MRFWSVRGDFVKGKDLLGSNACMSAPPLILLGWLFSLFPACYYRKICSTARIEKKHGNY